MKPPNRTFAKSATCLHCIVSVCSFEFMAMIEVDLDEFDTEEIVTTLAYRLKNGRFTDNEKERILLKIVEAIKTENPIGPERWRTQQDDLKEDALKAIADKFTVQQLWQIQEQGHC